jgi:hypothetical protein
MGIREKFNSAINVVTNNSIYDGLFGNAVWTGLMIAIILALIALLLFKDSVADKQEMFMTAFKTFLIGGLVSIVIVYLNNQRVKAATEKNNSNMNVDSIHREVIDSKGDIIGGFEDAFIPLSAGNAKLGAGGIIGGCDDCGKK